MNKILAYKKARNGTEFKIQNTGQNWTLFVKEKNKNKWERIQSDRNALFLNQVMKNQKEFKLKKVI